MNEFEDKLYQLTIENNANIKHLMDDHKSLGTELNKQGGRITKLENVGKKTVKEHLISFSKVCGAFLMIGGAYKLFIRVVETWQ